MPIYEYRCSKCDNVFEEWTQHFDSPHHEPCPKCGGDASRIVSNTSFVLKGQGWYVTEYGNKNKRDHESGAGVPDESSDAGVQKQAPEAKNSADKASTPSSESASGTSSASSASSTAESSPSKGDTKAA